MRGSGVLGDLTPPWPQRLQLRYPPPCSNGHSRWYVNQRNKPLSLQKNHFSDSSSGQPKVGSPLTPHNSPARLVRGLATVARCLEPIGMSAIPLNPAPPHSPPSAVGPARLPAAPHEPLPPPSLPRYSPRITRVSLILSAAAKSAAESNQSPITVISSTSP